MKLKKYFQVIKTYQQIYFAYRLNFILWRLRVVISVLVSYFLWSSIFQSQKLIFGYQEAQILTYLLLMIFINGIVLSTQTFLVAEEINRGQLSNFLLKPINYFAFVFSRDLSDKIVNTLFSIIEFILLFVILHPPIIAQTQPFLLGIFFLSLIFASVLYFEVSIILSFIGFWSKEIWAPRFLFFILASFLSGTFFPLDIVPKLIYNILQLLPFTYLVFFPLKIYLGGISIMFIVKGFMIALFWIVSLFFVMRYLWGKGLRLYTAEGR